MIYHPDTQFFYLFYSAPGFTEHYHVGVARSRQVDGPYEKHGDPILHEADPIHKWSNPGHCSVVEGPGQNATTLYMVYHAYEDADRQIGRQTLVDELFVDDGWPRVRKSGTPSFDPQPDPHYRHDK